MDAAERGPGLGFKNYLCHGGFVSIKYNVLVQQKPEIVSAAYCAWIFYFNSSTT